MFGIHVALILNFTQ